MKKTRSLFAVSFSVALAAACGGSSSDNRDAGRGGDSASGSGSGGGSGGGSGSGSGSSSGGGSGSSSGVSGGDGGAMCQCTAPQVCCVGGGGMRTFSCAANATSCPMRTAAVACMTSQSCGMGQVCCYLGSGTSISQCMASCPTGARQVCMSPADCPVTGSMCSSQSGGVYGFSTCRPPACTPTSCTAGELCCTAGGGTPTCQMGTACPMGDRQVCASNADCPAATPVCRGGPPTTCRAPADGGTDASPVEAGPVEAAPAETGAGDAPSGG
jgi:hypothetical protein